MIEKLKKIETEVSGKEEKKMNKKLKWGLIGAACAGTAAIIYKVIKNGRAEAESEDFEDDFETIDSEDDLETVGSEDSEDDSKDPE